MRSRALTRPASDKARFQFITQRPRDDGCGVFVLQMLTGRPYNQLAGMIDWGVRTNHYTTWKDLCGVLVALGWDIGELRQAGSWDDIPGVAVVHVEGDHFILYDADNGAFYDPGQSKGPDRESRLIPLSYLAVRPPESA